MTNLELAMDALREGRERAVAIAAMPQFRKEERAAMQIAALQEYTNNAFRYLVALQEELSEAVERQADADAPDLGKDLLRIVRPLIHVKQEVAGDGR